MALRICDLESTLLLLPQFRPRVNVFLCIIAIGTLIVHFQGCQAEQCSPGLTKTPQAFPICPDTLVTYTCIIAGTNFTAWTGSSFFHFCNDTFNETIIAHFYNESLESSANLTFANMSECGPFVAIRNDAQTTDGCYVSNLEFIASSTAVFNNTSIECLDGDGEKIGNDTVNMAGPPTIPLNLSLSSCDGSARTLTLMWDPPASNGDSELVRYGLTVEPPVPLCHGICYVDANITQFRFGPLNTSTHYTFTVHAENCNGSQQGDQSNITIFYGGPVGPLELSASLVYQEDELVSIISTWEEVVPLNIPTVCNLPVIGFEISYVSYFSSPVTLNISLDRCFGGTCRHTYDIIDFDIPMYTLSVASMSVLGSGPPTLLDLISARNDFVNITVNATTPYPEAKCQFLCGFGDSAVAANCGISYSTNVAEIGESSSFMDAPMTNGSMGETLSFPLTEPLPPNTVYCYQVDAFTVDQAITIHGNFTTGNYSAECDPAQLVAGNTSKTNSTICEDGKEGVVNYDNNILVCYNGSTHGSVAQVLCRKGYNFNSESVSHDQETTCQVNGLWDYYPMMTCRKRDTAAVIGGSVGGALGLLLLIVIIVITTITLSKYSKRFSGMVKNTKHVVKYNVTQGQYGAAEELKIMEAEDENPLIEIK